MRCGKDLTQDIRVFLCAGNKVLRLPVLRLLLDCREGVLCRVRSGTSVDLWILAVLESCDRAMLSYPML